MKRRAIPLTTTRTGSPRFWFVDVPERGEHTFRAPSYALGGAVMDALSRHYPDPTPGDWSVNEDRTHKLDGAGALVGACWWHAQFELETPPPPFSLTASDLDRYGRAVADELQDAGYTATEIITLGGAISGEFMARQFVIPKARATVDFGVPPGAGSTG